MKAKGVFICGNMHLTEVELINPQVMHEADGDYIEGLYGSSADFCDVCDDSNMMQLDIRVYES